jgi:hypothetical protein
MASFAVDAFAQRADEGLLGPAADAGIGVRRDVGAVERAERRFDRPAAGKRSSAFGGMADLAIADRGELRALCDQRWIERGACGHGVRRHRVGCACGAHHHRR